MQFRSPRGLGSCCFHPQPETNTRHQIQNFILMNSHLTEEATLSPTAPGCEGHEDSWGHRAAAGVSKSRQLGQGCLMASQLCKQTAVQVPPSFEHGPKSNARIFIEHYTKWKSFNLGNALETVHFLTYVTNCWSPTKACSSQQIRFWFFAFWDCGLIKTIHKTEKKNECNILKGEKKRRREETGQSYMNQLFDRFSFIYKGKGYPLTWQLTVNSLIPDSALQPSKWNARISFPNYWVALFVNSNYKASIYMPVYVHTEH